MKEVARNQQLLAFGPGVTTVQSLLKHGLV